MLTRILVPLDGSARAEQTLPVAARVARHSSGTLVLLRAVNLATDYWPAVMTLDPSLAQAVIDADLAAAEQYVRQVAASDLLAGLAVEPVVYHGPAASMILAAATAQTVDLIVMASHGSTGITRWMLGSVAEKVAHHAPVPVLLWRTDTPQSQTSFPYVESPLRMLVPLDGSAYAEAALEPAAQLVSTLKDPSQKGALHLVCIVKPPIVDAGDETCTLHSQRALTKTKQVLSRTVERIRDGSLAPTITQEHLMVTWSALLDQDVAGALVQVAENGEDTEGVGTFGRCSMMAMATHGRGGLQRWMMGSIAERVLQSTRLPLFMVRPKGEVTTS